jgi:Cu+-exporting ATPase
METTVLQVRGMRCASCVNHVEKNLAALPGVHDASVNLATEEAQVHHDPATAPIDRLIQAVRDAGYDATAQRHDHQPNEHEAAAEDEHAHVHEHDGASTWRWRLILCAALALAVVVLQMLFPSKLSSWLQLILATPVQIILGAPFYRGAWRGLKRLRADMDSLVALGTTVAYLYSAVVTFLGGIDVYFDTAVVILGLIGLGKWLEARARTSAASAIRQLMDLQPPQATVLRDGQEQTIPVGEVRPGDHLLVRPGQKIPVDGQITEGQSAIDQSMVTGESMPIDVGPHDLVYGGTVNQSGAFYFRATATGKAMLLSQVVELVKKAQASKAKVQRIVDQVAAVFVPVVLVIAVLSLLGWGLLTGQWIFAMTTMVAVLIVACPCALGLATPTAIMVGTGLGAKRGILIKDALALERAGKLTHIVLDKTGTLTVGRPQVTDVEPLNSDISTEDLLRFAAAVESPSEHPLGRAVVKHAQELGIDVPKVEGFESITAGGVIGRVNGHFVIVGRVTTLRDRGVENLDQLLQRRDDLMQAAKTAVAVAIDNQPAGLIAFSDRIRPEAAQVVQQLHALGLRTVMLSGDHQAAADAVAQRLSIDDVFAEVQPADKQAKVAQLQAQGAVVAMVGDGINDAPALAAADIGIAIGGGTDIAMEAGHVVLVGGDLTNLPRAIRLSRATMRRIYTGLFWAFIYNLVLIPVAVAGKLHPMFAAGAMAFSSVSVVMNALYLRWRWKP